MEKIKVMIVGGDDHRLPKTVKAHLDYIIIGRDEKTVPVPQKGCKLIAVIARFVSRALANQAVKIARKYNVPVIQVPTANSILIDMERRGMLQLTEPSPIDEKPETESLAAAPLAPVLPTTGLDSEQLWAQYGAKLVELINSSIMLQPGEKIDEAVLLEYLELPDGLGLPKEDCKKLLPELDLQGVLIRTVGSTWKRPDPSKDYEEDLEEAPKPVITKEPVSTAVEKPSKPRLVRERGAMALLVLKVGGLPEGPYVTKTAIMRDMRKYEDFLRLDGSEPTRQYFELLVKQAEANGVVTGQAGAWRVTHDPGIILAERAGYKPPKIKQRKVAARSSEPVSAKPAPKSEETRPPPTEPGAQCAPLAQARADEAKRQAQTGYISLTAVQPAAPTTERGVRSAARIASMVRESFGSTEIRPPDELFATIRKLRRMIPIEYWNECAARTLVKRVFPKGGAPWRDFLDVSEVMDIVEWDTLAWGTLKDMPVHVLAPWLRDELVDMLLTCEDCGKQFDFSAQEQEHFERKFGRVSPPRKCKPCRARARGDR